MRLNKLEENNVRMFFFADLITLEYSYYKIYFLFTIKLWEIGGPHDFFQFFFQTVHQITEDLVQIYFYLFHPFILQITNTFTKISPKTTHRISIQWSKEWNHVKVTITTRTYSACHITQLHYAKIEFCY